MTEQKAKELLESARQFLGQIVQMEIFNKESGKYHSVDYRFFDTASFVWKVQDEKPVVELSAKLQTLDGAHQISVGLSEIMIHLDRKQFLSKKISFKEIPLTHNGVTKTVYVAAVPALDNKINKRGYVACKYKVEDGEPVDYKKGDKILEKLYDDEDEAIAEGTQVLKIQFAQIVKKAKRK